MSFGRPQIVFLLIACFWSVSNSLPSLHGIPGNPSFQNGEGICENSQECSSGYECRTEQIIVPSLFPECSDLDSEVIARTKEWKNATLRSTIQATTLSDFYTNDTAFLYQLFPLFTGPPGGRTESSTKTLVGLFNSWVLGENSDSPSALIVEDIFHINDDLVLALNLIEATSYSTGFGAAYELVLWRREEGVLKAAVQTLNFVPRPRPQPEDTI